jgi:hypothetical protein
MSRWSRYSCRDRDADVTEQYHITS